MNILFFGLALGLVFAAAIPSHVENPVAPLVVLFTMLGVFIVWLVWAYHGIVSFRAIVEMYYVEEDAEEDRVSRGPVRDAMAYSRYHASKLARQMFAASRR